MYRITAIVVVLIVASAGQTAAQGPFDGWVWVSADRQGCRDCSVKVPPSDPRARQARESADAPLDPCSLTADDIRGWSAARITAAFQECAEITGYTEDPTDHTAGMIACRTRLRDAGRLLGLQGHGFRWTGTGLGTMFPDRRDGGGNVTTYIGGALEVEDSDGIWLPASYECDFDYAAGEIVDIRTGDKGVEK